MISKFYIADIEQKELYFRINNVLNLEKSTQEKEISGIYAIYKKGICLYVGQSKNLASRVATHLCGKYKEADYIYIFDIRDIGFSDYDKRNDVSKKSILDNCEKYMISILKPIENIIADFSFTLEKELEPDVFDEVLLYSFVIDNRENDCGYITISNYSSDDVICFSDLISVAIHGEETYECMYNSIKSMFEKLLIEQQKVLIWKKEIIWTTLLQMSSY